MSSTLEQRVTTSPLEAISPLDGRYRADIEALAFILSEKALIQSRFEVEGQYLVALSDAGVVRPFSQEERTYLIQMGPQLSLKQAQRVKTIEDTTHHDLKSVELAFREFVAGTSLSDVVEMFHFGLTSEDVNNLAFRLILRRATSQVCLPALDLITDVLVSRADEFKAVPMLARTHGQPAVPTTIGKEMVNFATRLNAQILKLQDIKLTGKLNGAVGNYNALALAVPGVDWIAFSQNFIRSFRFEPNLFTTQINPYDDMVEIFQAYQRVNNILLDLNQDMWRYISDDWFLQESKAGEVGSSVMPQKVNPIRHENSEGNLRLANTIFDGLNRDLPISRLQRDLSNSTEARNLGVALAHGLLAYKNTHAGLLRAFPNRAQIHADLHKNWTILSEGVQTVLRQGGVADPYKMVADLTKGQRLVEAEWQLWVNNLPKDQVNEKTRAILLSMNPDTYVGYAVRLTEIAIEQIKQSKQAPPYTDRPTNLHPPYW